MSRSPNVQSDWSDSEIEEIYLIGPNSPPCPNGGLIEIRCDYEKTRPKSCNPKSQKVNKPNGTRPKSVGAKKVPANKTKQDLGAYLKLGPPQTRSQSKLINGRSLRNQKAKPQKAAHKPSKSPEPKKRLQVNLKQVDLQHMNLHKLYKDLSEIESVVERTIKTPTLESFEDIDKRVANFRELLICKASSDFVMPPPPHKIPKRNFDDSIEDIVQEVLGDRKRRRNSDSNSNTTVKDKKLVPEVKINLEPLKDAAMLRTALTNITEHNQSNTPEKTDNFEIVSFETSEEDIDLQNFIDDMLCLDKMSEEHRRSVIETRILSSSSITNIVQKNNTEEKLQRAYKIFNELSQNGKENGGLDSGSSQEQNTAETEATLDTGQVNGDPEQVIVDLEQVSVEQVYVEQEQMNDITKDDEIEEIVIEEAKVQSIPKETLDQCEEELHEKSADDIKPDFHDTITFEHDYTRIPDEDPDEDDEDCDSLKAEPINLPIIPVRQVRTKSLLSSLTLPKRKKVSLCRAALSDTNYSIKIDLNNGPVLKAFYHDFNLVLIQSQTVSFWMQSPLGNVLGAQNLYIPKGCIQRLSLNVAYRQKETLDMLVTTNSSVACIELWTKEHKSDYRQVPLADVFANVYFWRQGLSGIDKKALQLENITGMTEDVQYVVLKSTQKIVVSWFWTKGTEKLSKVHCYQLADDFQTVLAISEIQEVEHYIASLHNIDDCDDLVMGCGQNRITLWNVDYGYIVATIQLTNMGPVLSTHWVKCDRGFVFTVQQCSDMELRLIAINGMNKSWKILQNFIKPAHYDGLKGAHLKDDGILIAFYKQGILCWNVESGQLFLEAVPDDDFETIPCGKSVVVLQEDQVFVRDALSHLFRAEELIL